MEFSPTLSLVIGLAAPLSIGNGLLGSPYGLGVGKLGLLAPLGLVVIFCAALAAAHASLRGRSPRRNGVSAESRQQDALGIRFAYDIRGGALDPSTPRRIGKAPATLCPPRPCLFPLPMVLHLGLGQELLEIGYGAGSEELVSDTGSGPDGALFSGRGFGSAKICLRKPPFNLKKDALGEK
ncbi:hypothetical protein HNY73_009220 [Argiope bruennichi]|uniref:Uncharacterized protein n=1 Tax=Argiope bruennichi TaxID=94029 RepID=A0A8T0FBA9_ARGBR|nr:hypothetical protein HNY73_009220 [Argiope bruennichi]